jgi:hypothetical protein
LGFKSAAVVLVAKFKVGGNAIYVINMSAKLAGTC